MRAICSELHISRYCQLQKLRNPLKDHILNIGESDTKRLEKEIDHIAVKLRLTVLLGAAHQRETHMHLSEKHKQLVINSNKDHWLQASTNKEPTLMGEIWR